MSTIKLFVALIIFSCTLNSFGQFQSEHNYYFTFDYHKAKYSPVEYSPKKEVKEVHFKVENTKKGKFSNYVKTYNEEGKLLEFYKRDSDGKQPILKYIFKNDSTGSLVFDKNGKLKNESYIVVNDKGNRTAHYTLDGKGKVVQRNIWTYNSDGCVLTSKRYKKGDKLEMQWSYEYFSKCDKSKSVLMNSKGKVLNTWSYACKEEGEKLTKKKDVTQVCKFNEDKDGFLVKVTQDFDEKGNITKDVYTYRKSDTAIVSIKCYYANEQVNYESFFDYTFKKPTLRRGFTKSGKPTYEEKSVYKDDLIISNQYSYKGKLRRRSTFEYTDEGYLKAVEKYDSKNELKGKVDLKNIIL